MGCIMPKSKNPNDNTDKTAELTAVANAAASNSHFEDLPSEMKQEIGSHLRKHDLDMLRSTSRQLHVLFHFLSDNS